MLGEKGLSGDWSTSPNAGLIPRCIIELFKALDQSLKSYQLSVSYLELHNNKLLDLLVLDDRRPPRILRNAEGNDVMVGMERPDVNSVHDAYKVLSQGLKKRKVAATKMNINSSRSHTVFTVYVDITETDAMGQEIRRNGSLNLVDLGGSENIERSGAVHARAREAGNINQDLLHLGTVIRNLVEGKIIEGMYRGKVLTQLLRNSLGGKAKTKFIATVGPASCNVQETLRTLEYCFTAKNVKNRPEMNATCMNKSFIDEDDESLYVNKYEKEIIRLRKDLFAAREQNGMYMSQESYDQQQQHTTSLQDQCNELNGILSIIKEQHQREKSALMDQLMEAKDQLKEHEVDINKKVHPPHNTQHPPRNTHHTCIHAYYT
ncbi:hypothetical protein SARC_07506 [Sphaeroforma arctica JP610]|uniref:Kinesin motor domain-containing protein n=1 Tax=Sphaeroforma arctica JP610 TaxID=667725 RepID=A0A0L0FTZ5_9EUKA|nr:hypothetical protein SARC_07506 [Sphaeroforma arctica JP610]KNC80119.1 hypothetical protein SARC_07506 [Sphaeroforma arctica JP610]|eukprot:XP_014154021.1 hypothetical protein SARC_07506 [Sphaeroforma arctica JP610]